MREWSQAVWGVLAALFSAFLVFGGLAISLAESNTGVALAPTEIPTSTQPVPTQAPGEPTYTPSPTPLPTATATIEFPNACDYPPDWIEVQVGAGDTLASIAERYQVSVNILRLGNCLELDGLMAGMTIHVPAPPMDTPLPSEIAPPAPTQPPSTNPQAACPRPPGWVVYFVRAGDNLYRIGLAVGVPYTQLAARNCLKNYTIYTGQRLYVPRLPVFPVSPTPLPYLSPTPVIPIASPTLLPPTNVPPTAVPPSPTPVVHTATPGLPTSTPVTPSPTQVIPTATPTNTAPPRVTDTPLPTAAYTDTPLPPPPTAIPTATWTAIPLPSRTPLPTRELTPRATLILPTP